jgi:hypothetical protein
VSSVTLEPAGQISVPRAKNNSSKWIYSSVVVLTPD